MFWFKKKSSVNEDKNKEPPLEEVVDETSEDSQEGEENIEKQKSSLDFKWLSPILNLIWPGFFVYIVVRVYLDYLRIGWFFENPMNMFVGLVALYPIWLFMKAWVFMLVRIREYVKKDPDKPYLKYIWEFKKFPVRSLINSFVIKRRPDDIVAITRLGKVHKILTMGGVLKKKEGFKQKEGVRDEFRKGGGLAGKIPLADKFYVADGSRRKIDLKPFYTMTKDGKPVMVNMLIRLQISDIYTYFFLVDNPEEDARDLAQTRAREFVSNHNFDVVNSLSEEESKKTLKIMQSKSDEWGVNVTEFRIQNIVPAGEEFKKAVSVAAGINAMAIQKAEAAKKEAEAIKTLANARAEAIEINSKVVAGNPDKMKVMELLTTKEVAEKVSSLNILGTSVTEAISNIGNLGGVNKKPVLVEK